LPVYAGIELSDMDPDDASVGSEDIEALEAQLAELEADAYPGAI
jgi:hypothetical protein